MNVAVLNPRKVARVNLPALRTLARHLAGLAFRGQEHQWRDLSIVLANDRQIRDLNREHLGHDDVTDVISFGFDAMPGEAGGLRDGELVVGVELAFRLGPRYGGAARELALYIAHGLDHLAGADDRTPAERRRMRRRELRWLTSAAGRGLIAPILAPPGGRGP
jgi:probable rRNA maturation factor